MTIRCLIENPARAGNGCGRWVMAEDSKKAEPEPSAAPLQWDASDPMRSLARLYAATLEKARQQIDWYRKKAGPKRFGSQACRFTAIVLLGLAALIPLLKAAGLGQPQPAVVVPGQPAAPPQGTNYTDIPFELGYAFAAVAAGMIAFDKYFGLSTGWIRYIQTQLALQSAVDELQYDWVALLAKVQGRLRRPKRLRP